jgi:hypothetical protein
MDEWKIRQEIYHRLNKNHTDDLSNKTIEINQDIVYNSVRYFKENNLGWIYPAKSYMVAICYARWLSEEFGKDPIGYLNDPDLLYKNDPYFIVYDEDPNTYSRILEEIGGWNFSESSGMVPDVRQYFDEEFMLNDEFGV